MSKHRDPTPGKNPLHGNNTLIGKVPEGLVLDGHHRLHGQKCSLCEHFRYCVDVMQRGNIADSNYCHTPSKGFKRMG